MLLVFGALVVAVIVFLYAFSRASGEAEARSALAEHALRYFYIFSAFLFILGLKGLCSPRYARRGMFLAEFGMVLAIVGTLFHPEIESYGWIVVGMVVGVRGRRRDGPADPDDRRAAANRALALARRARRDADRRFGIHAARRRHRHRQDDRDRPRGDDRRPHLHRQPDGRRQAAGAAPRRADHLPRPERLQHLAARDHARELDHADLRPLGDPALLRHGRSRAAVRLPARHADRRRRHAGRHRAAQLLRRTRRRLDGLRADEQDPDHHRLARRHLGLPAFAPHVPSDESLGDERAVRRLRQGRSRGGGTRSGGQGDRALDHRRTRCRAFSTAPAR